MKLQNSTKTFRWICQSDAECGKALEYYHLFCRAMFRGKRCSQRCKNSIDILRQREKAKQLDLCKYAKIQNFIKAFPKYYNLVKCISSKIISLLLLLARCRADEYLDDEFRCHEVKSNMASLCYPSVDNNNSTVDPASVDGSEDNSLNVQSTGGVRNSSGGDSLMFVLWIATVTVIIHKFQ